MHIYANLRDACSWPRQPHPCQNGDEHARIRRSLTIDRLRCEIKLHVDRLINSKTGAQDSDLLSTQDRIPATSRRPHLRRMRPLRVRATQTKCEVRSAVSLKRRHDAMFEHSEIQVARESRIRTPQCERERVEGAQRDGRAPSHKTTTRADCKGYSEPRHASAAITNPRWQILR